MSRFACLLQSMCLARVKHYPTALNEEVGRKMASPDRGPGGLEVILKKFKT